MRVGRGFRMLTFKFVVYICAAEKASGKAPHPPERPRGKNHQCFVFLVATPSSIYSNLGVLSKNLPVNIVQPALSTPKAGSRKARGEVIPRAVARSCTAFVSGIETKFRRVRQVTRRPPCHRRWGAVPAGSGPGRPPPPRGAQVQTRPGLAFIQG